MSFFEVGNKVLTEYGVGYITKIYEDDLYPLYQVRLRDKNIMYMLNENKIVKLKEYGVDDIKWDICFLS